MPRRRSPARPRLSARHNASMPSARANLWSRPSVVAVGYLALALAMTWPLASVITEQIAGDLGDSLFNSWILLWTSGQVLGALGGNISALGDYWNGNIFYPAPLTLAYSEHLTPQMLQALPVVAATGNVVLAYNVVFLATIVLSGLGVYLLVRELTGRPLAAFLAGLAFAFAPYRLDQYEHIEVLSSQWMPFAIFGFRRFFTTGRLRALLGGTAALVAQALSCGYYLAYFTPFAVAYCLFEIGARQRMRDVRTWRALIAAGAIALVVVGAFLWPYATVRRGGDVGVRARGEIEHFSADTHAFATISRRSWLWGSRIQALPRDQGRGFPGFTALALSCLAIGVAVARAAARGRAQAQTRVGLAPRCRDWTRWQPPPASCGDRAGARHRPHGPHPRRDTHSRAPDPGASRYRGRRPRARCRVAPVSRVRPRREGLDRRVLRMGASRGRVAVAGPDDVCERPQHRQRLVLPFLSVAARLRRPPGPGAAPDDRGAVRCGARRPRRRVAARVRAPRECSRRRPGDGDPRRRVEQRDGRADPRAAAGSGLRRHSRAPARFGRRGVSVRQPAHGNPVYVSGRVPRTPDPQRLLRLLPATLHPARRAALVASDAPRCVRRAATIRRNARRRARSGLGR